MTIAAQGVLAPLLRTLFANVDGNPSFIVDETRKLESGDIAEIETFLSNQDPSEPIALDLVTSSDECGCEAEMFADADAAGDFAEARQDDPILALKNGATGAIFLVYGLATPVQGAAAHFATHPDLIRDLPTPGYGGWTLTDSFLADFMDASQAAAGDPDAPAAEPEAEYDPTLPFKFHDAEFVGGELAADVLDLELKIAVGLNKQDKRWVPKKMTWGNLVAMLSKHPVSADKDGKAFIQGSAIANQRTAKAMEQMSVVGLDADTGIDMNRFIDFVQNELKLTAVFYTTHSNEKTESAILEGSFTVWAKKNGEHERPTQSSMRRYLREKLKWEETIVSTVTLADDMVHTQEGIKYALSHAPMPKFRILFPLAVPYVIAKQGMSQLDAINRWKGKLLGLAKLMQNLPIDESCLDPSRLFYLPRHPEGMPFRVVVTAGQPLDFDVIPEINMRSRADLTDDVFARAAQELGAGVGTLIYKDFNLRAWSAKVADTFMMSEVIRAYAPNRIRTDYNTDKIEIECPFDHEHSNAGDIEDRAAWAINAHGDGSEKPFHIGCQHNTCKNRSKLEFVCQMLEDEWFGVDVLQDDRMRVPTVEEQEVFYDPVQVAKDAIESLAEIGLGPDGVVACEALIIDCIDKGVSASMIGALTDEMVKRKIVKKREIGNFVNDARKEHNKKTTKKVVGGGEITDHLKARGVVVNMEAERICLSAAMGHRQQVDKIREIIDQKNKLDPRLFDYGGGKMHCEMVTAYADTRISGVDRDQLAVYLEPHLEFYVKTKEDDYKSVPFDDKVLREVAASYNWYCPELEGFAALPYFNKSAVLVRKDGYDNSSKIYLKPAIDLATLNVPSNPTKEQIAESVRLIMEEVYGDFPFNDGADGDPLGRGSRASLLAMLLHPFVRPMVNGPTPIYLVSKPTAGTGATKLIQTALMINSGRDDIEGMTEAQGEEECQKKITSAFKAGKTFFWVDNVHAELKSAAYCNLATSPVWEDRTLGKSELVKYPNKLQFILSGNNPRGTYEIMRRCIPIRLDFKGDPREREASEFRHPDLLAYVTENRKTLIEALLTLVTGWIAAGKPEFSGRPLMSFEQWSFIVGGILQNAGVPGFLSNLDLTQKFADEETRAWESIVQDWANKNGVGEGSKGLKAVDVAEMMMTMDDYPNIGVRYPLRDGPEGAKTIAPRVRERLDIKEQSPHKIADPQTGEIIRVAIYRVQDQKTRNMVYQLRPM